MKDSERLLKPFLSDTILAFSGENMGWIQTARQALFLSAADVAKKLKISRTALAIFETGERQGRISLNTLAKVATGKNFLQCKKPARPELVENFHYCDLSLL